MPPLRFQDEALFEELIQNHYPDLLRYTWILVRRMGALEIGSNIVEDTIQEALLQAWRFPDRLKTVEDALFWIYAALDLKLRELLRSERQWANCLQKLQLDSDPEILPMPEEWIDLHAALDSLPKEDAHLLYLYFWEGYSHRELSELTGCSLTNMTTKMHRIRRKLEKFLKKNKNFKIYV